jgi:hypothetical protein
MSIRGADVKRNSGLDSTYLSDRKDTHPSMTRIHYFDTSAFTSMTVSLHPRRIIVYHFYLSPHHRDIALAPLS